MYLELMMFMDRLAKEAATESKEKDEKTLMPRHVNGVLEVVYWPMVPLQSTNYPLRKCYKNSEGKTPVHIVFESKHIFYNDLL